MKAETPVEGRDGQRLTGNVDALLTRGPGVQFVIDGHAAALELPARRHRVEVTADGDGGRGVGGG